MPLSGVFYFDVPEDPELELEPELELDAGFPDLPA